MFGRSCLVTVITVAILVLALIISFSSGTPAFNPFLVIVGYTLLVWFGALAFNHAIKWWLSHDFVPKEDAQRTAVRSSRPVKIQQRNNPTSQILDGG